MKLSYYLVPATLLIAAPISGAATVSAKINRYASVGQIQSYTFTELGIGSITLQTVLTPSDNGSTINTSFTNLDGGLRVGNGIDGDGNAFSSTREGFNLSVKLTSSDPNIDTSTIQFSVDSIGIRSLTGGWPALSPHYNWKSSASNPNVRNLGHTNIEALRPLDTSAYGDLSTKPYTGSFTMPTPNQGIQLTDNVTGGNGLVMSATFAIITPPASVPEPSSTALLTLGIISLILRRRK